MMAFTSEKVYEDLAWLISCPMIVSDLDLSLYWHQDVEARLARLKQDPAGLIAYMRNNKSHFLGSYFESLFSYAIEHLSVLKILHEHVQISEKGRTLGELDMLVATPSGQMLQLEIAIKFYLERPDLSPHHWIGPNKRDSLYKKERHARQHQLAILQTEPGQEWFHSRYPEQTVEPKLLIFGRLFKAMGSVVEHVAHQSCGPNLNEFGYYGWLKKGHLNSLKPCFKQATILNKPHWLALPSSPMGMPLEQLEQGLEKQFLQDDRPVNVCLWKEGASSTAFNCFIVPDDW
ncbi:DUF1853 family protein [Marinomonas epiphytica]